MKIEPINSKYTKIVGSLFLLLTIQLSIVVFGISHIISPFAMSPIIQTVVAQVDQAFKTYDNPKFGLTVPYPPTWSVDELRKDPATASNNSIVAIFKSPAEGQNDKYLENVIVNVQGPRSDIKSLEQYTQNSVKAFNNMSDTIKITQSRSDTLAGLPAHKLEYTSSAPNGLNLKKMQVFTVVNNNTASSWGHHYPAAVYAKQVARILVPGGIVIMDIRRKSMGIDEMRQAGFRYIGQVPDHSHKCYRWIFTHDGE